MSPNFRGRTRKMEIVATVDDKTEVSKPVTVAKKPIVTTPPVDPVQTYEQESELSKPRKPRRG
jgi:hypothetical protein